MQSPFHAVIDSDPTSALTIPLGLWRTGLFQGLCHGLRQFGAVLEPSFGERGVCELANFELRGFRFHATRYSLRQG